MRHSVSYIKNLQIILGEIDESTSESSRSEKPESTAHSSEYSRNQSDLHSQTARSTPITSPTHSQITPSDTHQLKTEKSAKSPSTPDLYRDTESGYGSPSYSLQHPVSPISRSTPIPNQTHTPNNHINSTTPHLITSPPNYTTACPNISQSYVSNPSVSTMHGPQPQYFTNNSIPLLTTQQQHGIHQQQKQQHQHQFQTQNIIPAPIHAYSPTVLHPHEALSSSLVGFAETQVGIRRLSDSSVGAFSCGGDDNGFRRTPLQDSTAVFPISSLNLEVLFFLSYI